MDCTKGDWKFTRLNAPATHGIKVSDDLFSSITSGNEVVCLLPEPHYTPNMGDMTWHREQVDIMKANAQLIISAPDLHRELVEADEVICELCKRLNPQHAPRGGYEGCNSCQDRESRLQALAKAEGK